MQWLMIQAVYWPTLVWNVLLGRWVKIRPWWSEIDDRLIVGALPMKSDVQRLHELGVRAIVNTCREYHGPLRHYEQLGIEQFHMPTIDFTHPQIADIRRAIQFIDSHVDRGHKVYVHCKAGRARSATVALCWLCYRDDIDAVEAQLRLQLKRPHINPRIKDRAVVQQFIREDCTNRLQAADQPNPATPSPNPDPPKNSDLAGPAGESFDRQIADNDRTASEQVL